MDLLKVMFAKIHLHVFLEDTFMVLLALTEIYEYMNTLHMS